MSSLKTLCNEVELLIQYPEIGLAISDSSNPVPGYLFGEINAITYMDYGNYCKPLVNFLISRLQAQTPLVSIKILKLLLHLVKNGHTEMVEEVKYHEVALKEALSFHGPPDDFHGKTFYETIRKLSKELLEFIFSENKDVSANVTPPDFPELTGYGSNANSKKLPGFGYSIKTQKSVSDKISDGVSNFVEKLLPTNEKEVTERQTSHLGEALPQYKPLIINRDSLVGDDLTAFAELSTSQKSTPIRQSKQKTRVYKPGKPRGGWDDSDDEIEEEDKENNDELVNQTKENLSKASSLSFDCIELNKLEVKDNIIDWADEHKIVDAFAIDEPLHMIDYSATASFCKQCSALNCDKILMFLLEKLEDKKELVQLRALIFVEYLIFHDIVSLESLVKILVSPLNNFIEKSEDSSDSVKIKAKKVCLIIRNLCKSSSHPLLTSFPQLQIKSNT